MRTLILLISLLVSAIPLSAQRIQKDKGGLYGLASSKKNGQVKWIVKPIYTEIKNNNDGTFAVRNQSGKWGVIAISGKEIIACIHDTKESANSAHFSAHTEEPLIASPGKKGKPSTISATLPYDRNNAEPLTEVMAAPTSDVDVDIPVSKRTNDTTFALIFANENYREEVPVAFASNDGTAVEQYFMRTLGIPSENIRMVKDATRNDMLRQLDWLSHVGTAYSGDINILVYYAGHGVPSETDGSAYLIPVDGVASNTKTLYSLSDFYNELGSIPAQSATIFLDACFSGASRGDGMLAAAARGVAIKPKATQPKGNMVVISAAQGDETAWSFTEKGHGLFTYFLLKKLQESGGSATLGEISDYVTSNVSRRSIVVNNKPQTPTVNASSSIEDSWQKIRLM